MSAENVAMDTTIPTTTVGRRREPRLSVEIAVQVWGTDVEGTNFSQQSVATNISRSGALLSKIGYEVRCGDLIGIAYQARKCRFRVVWVRNSNGPRQIQVAVQRLETDNCPWEDVLAHTSVGSSKRAPF